MLKIKDNVDLKELEKFGLMPHDKYPEIYRYVKEYSLMELEEGAPIWIGISSNDPKVLYRYKDTYCLNINDTIADILFDLIQAGLVEKVEE